MHRAGGIGWEPAWRACWRPRLQWRPPGEELVPASTKGFFSVPKMPDFRQTWDKIPLAR